MITRTSPIETAIGLTTTIALKPLVSILRLLITCTMTRPTTSSSMAALERTVPSRLSINPLVLRTVNVVPKLVEHSAAPAANACNGEASARPRKENDKAIGRTMPVVATEIDSIRFFLSEAKEVERPPVIGSEPRVLMTTECKAG